MPAEVLGGGPGEYLEYREIGKSEAYGTSHFSTDTVEALVALVQQTSNGQRVNSIFGEGVSPKFRKLRDGLGALGLPVDALLQHGRRRIVYGVPLVRNLREYLVGMDDEPDYLFSLENPERSTTAIVEWWMSRWLSQRIMNDEVLASLDEHTLVRPIRHGGRVACLEWTMDRIPSSTTWPVDANARGEQRSEMGAKSVGRYRYSHCPPGTTGFHAAGYVARSSGCRILIGTTFTKAPGRDSMLEAQKRLAERFTGLRDSRAGSVFFIRATVFRNGVGAVECRGSPSDLAVPTG